MGDRVASAASAVDRRVSSRCRRGRRRHRAGGAASSTGNCGREQSAAASELRHDVVGVREPLARQPADGEETGSRAHLLSTPARAHPDSHLSARASRAEQRRRGGTASEGDGRRLDEASRRHAVHEAEHSGQHSGHAAQ